MQRTTTPYTLLFLLLAVCLSSCSRRYKVEGLSSVTALEGKTLYLKVLENGEWTAVDSAEMVHGLFRMEGPADSARMVTLYLDEECIMPLVLENGTVKVTLTNSQFIAQGTPLNDALYEFIEKRNQMERCLGDLERKSIRLAMSGLARQEDLERLKKEKHRKKQEWKHTCVPLSRTTTRTSWDKRIYDVLLRPSLSHPDPRRPKKSSKMLLSRSKRMPS